MAGKLTGRQKIEARTEEIAAPVAAEYGVEIYDVSYDKEGKEFFLNVYIDKEGGVNILDCENVRGSFRIFSTRRTTYRMPTR